MKINWKHIVMFSLVILGIIYISIPTSDTLIEMSREGDDPQRLMRLLYQRIESDPGDAEACLELADIYLTFNDIGNEKKMLEMANQRRPNDPAIQYRLAIILINDNQLDEALAVLPEKYRDRVFMLQVVAYYDKVGDLRMAEQTLLETEKDYLDNPQTWLSIARWRADSDNPDGEYEALRRVFELDPENGEAWKRYFTNRAWELDVDETTRAVDMLEKLDLATPDHYQTLYELQMSNQDIAGAVKTLDKMSRFVELAVFRQFEHAVILYRNGEYDKGDEALLRLLAEKRDEPLPQGTVNFAFEYLRESAEFKENLDLALRLAGMSAGDPAADRMNRMTALRLGFLKDRLDLVSSYFDEFISDPGATADIIVMGVNMAYRTGDFAAVPDLLERLKSADNPFDVEIGLDGIVYAMLENETKTIDQWRAELRENPESVQKMVGLSRAAVRENNVSEAAAAVDQALSRLQPDDFIDAFGLFESILYLAGTGGEGGQAQAVRLEQADRLAAGLEASALGGNRWFLSLLADLRDRQGRAEEATQLWVRLTRQFPDDSSSWLGMARSAAARGDDATVESVLNRLNSLKEERVPEEVRDSVYVCFTLSDFHRSSDPDLADQWLKRAEEIYRANVLLFPDTDAENINMEADLLERKGDWNEAFAFWKRSVDRRPDDINAWLGIARAAAGKKDSDEAWKYLTHVIDVGATGLDIELQLAGQLLELAEETPEDSPARAERLDFAFKFAEERLRKRWDPELAATLVWRVLEMNDFTKARDFLSRSGDYATPEMHASLAEAFLAAAVSEQEKAGFMPDDLRNGALAEALAACRGKDRNTMMRAAYVLSEVNEKDKLREVLGWIEATDWTGDPEDLTSLIQLADAYSVLGEFDRQYELAEKRARLGGEPEWLDAIDRHMWNSDFDGAIRIMREAEEKFPDSGEIFSREISIHADNNRPGVVIATFERARQHSPGIETKLTGDALAAIADSYDETRSVPQARRFYRLSLEKAPANKRGAMGAARLQRRDGNLAGAIKHLQAYVEATPDDPWGWLELANYRSDASATVASDSSFSRASYGSGRSEYARVVELTEPDKNGDIPKDVVAARAVSLRRLGREREAMRLLQNTVEDTIESPDVACDYAQMLMEIYRYDEAEQVLRKTVKQFPYHVWAYRLEATILVRRQRYDLAVARLKEALQWAPNDGEVQRDLAFAAQLWERTWKSQKGWLTAGGR
ncbi:MAG: tetratricopeptide repeat protein [Planctomycetota bacterium]|nr:tetratricopeptide repeat protein [Planctomycetota bacterium]